MNGYPYLLWQSSEPRTAVVHDHHPVIEVCMTKSLTEFSDWPRHPDIWKMTKRPWSTRAN
jgi:hypothetical protein